jgi:hypothetical protein
MRTLTPSSGDCHVDPRLAKGDNVPFQRRVESWLVARGVVAWSEAVEHTKASLIARIASGASRARTWRRNYLPA